MKKTLVIATVLLLSACSETPSYVEGGSQFAASKQSVSEIRYFKDKRTGLCFAERGMSDDYAFTCVPCDSVKNFIQK